MSAILKRLTAIFIFSLAAACNSEPATTDKATTQAANTTADTALVRVQFQTSMGSFVASLDPVKAPVTVENFLRYVDEGFYNNTIFHRVINDFMVQGGGFNPDMQQKNPHEPIQNEANNGLQNTVGTLAMARTSAPHSATAQFFINVKDNVFLNHRAENHAGWGYAVFGEVTEGMETINAIKLVETGNHSHYQNVPVEPVIIQQVSRLSD